MLYNITLIADADGISFMDEVNQKVHELREFDDEVASELKKVDLDYVRYEAKGDGFHIGAKFMDGEEIEIHMTVDNTGHEKVKDLKGDLHHVNEFTKINDFMNRVSKRVTEIMQAA